MCFYKREKTSNLGRQRFRLYLSPTQRSLIKERRVCSDHPCLGRLTSGPRALERSPFDDPPPGSSTRDALLPSPCDLSLHRSVFVCSAQAKLGLPLRLHHARHNGRDAPSFPDTRGARSLPGAARCSVARVQLGLALLSSKSARSHRAAKRTFPVRVVVRLAKLLPARFRRSKTPTLASGLTALARRAQPPRTKLVDFALTIFEVGLTQTPVFASGCGQGVSTNLLPSLSAKSANKSTLSSAPPTPSKAAALN